MTDNGNITDILKDEERILVAAWMLPNEGSLTDPQRRQAMDNFTRYIRSRGMTPVQVAHQLGKPRATTIGDLIKGKYRANADIHIRSLNLWVEQDARKRAASLTGNFVTTLKVAKDMLKTARLCRENGTMALAFGASGIGKSRCAVEIHAKYVGSIYLRVATGSRNPRGLTRALAEKLGVRSHSSYQKEREPHTQLERVVNVLRDSGRLLILDEAAKLTDDAIELLRDLHDECGVPVLLIATRDLHERIVKNAGPDHGQLYSRFDVVKSLTEGYDVYQGGSNKPLHTIADIKALYNEPPLRLTTDAQHYLQDVANMLGYGSLRTCRILLQNAARRARKRQGLGEGDKVTVSSADLEWVEARLKQESTEQARIDDRRRLAAGMVGG